MDNIQQMAKLSAATHPGLPTANLYGLLGQRCPVCSGLGHVFRPRIAFAAAPGFSQCTSPSRCVCSGTGIDPEWVRQKERDALYGRLSDLESKYQSLLSLTSQTRVPQGKASRQYFMETIAWVVADGTAIANTTTETIIFPNITIPANYMQDGRVLRLRAFGKLSTTATPTITFAARWGGVGGTLLATTEALTNGSGVTNVNWSAEALIQTRSNGSTGTLLVMGECGVHTSATAIAQNIFSVSGYDAPAAVTADLTADTALSFTADWSAASASNTLTGMVYTLESMN